MSQEWIQFLDQVNSIIKKWDDDEECDFPVFRGHADESWDLEPSLIRLKKELTPEEYNRLESALYFDFVTYSARGSRFQTPWETLFEMRHHGLPTRLLDWSESFAMALFFALADKPQTPTVWILNPYKLNEISIGDSSLVNPNGGLKFTYEDGYLNEIPSKKTEADLMYQPINPIFNQPYSDPIAIVPPLSTERLFAQKGLFTLQGKGNDVPLNKDPKFADCIVKMRIPEKAFDDALSFIQLSGVNEFSAFPDLDGLSRHLQKKYRISQADIFERKREQLSATVFEK